METTFGLEGDLQIALRSNIEQLEQGLLRCSTTPVVWQFHPYLSTTLTTPILRFITHNLTGLSFYLFPTLTVIFAPTTYSLSTLPHERTSFVELSAVWRLGSCGSWAHI